MGADGMDAEMQTALAALLTATCGRVEVSALKPVFGGNARKAYAFDARTELQGLVPCILLSQVAAKHVESDPEAEFGVLRSLNGSGVRAPRALAFDRNGVITGSPAIVLERIEGSASAVDFLAMSEAEGRALSEDFARATGELHRLVPAAETANPVIAQIDHWQDQFRRHRL